MIQNEKFYLPGYEYTKTTREVIRILYIFFIHIHFFLYEKYSIDFTEF